MNAWMTILGSWNFYPSVIIGCAVLLVWYCRSAQRPFKLNLRSANFITGIAVTFLALCSPIDELSDDYLFSAHMLQHVMLGLIAPGLMIAGLSGSMVENWLKMPFIARMERVLGNPFLAVVIGIGVFSVWHIPALYDATLESEGIHIFEHLTLLISGSILWWPVLKPVSRGRLSPMAAVVYLSIASFLQSILGVGLSLADTPFYSAYAHPHDELGILKVLRDDWGITQLDDQRTGGAIMWAFGGVIFLWVMMVAMVDWFREEHPKATEQADRRTENVATK